MKLTPTEPDVRTIVDRIENGDIDLQPDFQRQEVWSTNKKKRLIDTVLRGWSIPPVHLVEGDQSQLEVLDGQQRLAALRDFILNRFSIDGRITPFDQTIANLHGRFYKQLDPATRRRIDQFPIRCFRISDYTPEEPNELFYRLNQPTILTAGEQRNALYGPTRRQLKELVEYFTGGGNSKETIGFSNVRLAYDDVIARLLYFLEAKNFGAKSTEMRISERFRSQNPFPVEALDRARCAIAIFSRAREISKTSRFNKASLLSWLLFFSRFNADDANIVNSIQIFLDVSQGAYSGRNLTDAVLLFENRSSLRVTDVSSVVYRDFVLCYVYHFAAHGALPIAIDLSALECVASQASVLDHASFESVVSQVIDIDAWSKAL